MKSVARQGQLTALNTYVNLTGRGDETSLPAERPNGTAKKIIIASAVDGAVVGASVGLLRITGFAGGQFYVPFALAGGTLATTGIAAIPPIILDVNEPLSGAELKFEAAMCVVDTGSAAIMVAVLYE